MDVNTTGWLSVLTVLPEAESVARDEVVAELQEGVLVIDRQGQIIDLNAAAESALDRTARDALGQRVESVLDVHLTKDDEVQTATRRTSDGVREFEVNVSSLGSDDAIGRTVVLRDVTQRQTRERRLQVLQRVLRHNLRNDLDVILAHADRVDDPETRRSIRGPAKGLVEKAKKARDTERFFERDRSQMTGVDVSTLARSVASKQRDRYPDSEISVTATEELSVHTHETVLERVLTELVENAIEHTEASDPVVYITVQTDGGNQSIVFDVADNGPGISDRERQIVREGVESPHRHASGVGLWLVTHAVTHLGGTVSFETPPAGGTISRVRLPRTGDD